MSLLIGNSPGYDIALQVVDQLQIRKGIDFQRIRLKPVFFFGFEQAGNGEGIRLKIDGNFINIVTIVAIGGDESFRPFRIQCQTEIIEVRVDGIAHVLNFSQASVIHHHAEYVKAAQTRQSI